MGTAIFEKYLGKITGEISADVSCIELDAELSTREISMALTRSVEKKGFRVIDPLSCSKMPENFIALKFYRDPDAVLAWTETTDLSTQPPVSLRIIAGIKDPEKIGYLLNTVSRLQGIAGCREIEFHECYYDFDTEIKGYIKAEFQIFF